jgi:carboxyl-terminal processing protease
MVERTKQKNQRSIIYSLVKLIAFFSLIMLSFVSLTANVVFLLDKYSSFVNIGFTPNHQVIEIIKNESINPLPDEEEEKEEWQLKGLVQSLQDPYSVYLPAEEAEDFRNSVNERYEGVGIRFEFTERGVLVQEVIGGSPAEAAGVLSGDILKEIDGEDVDRMEFSEIGEKIRGPEGSTVELTFFREDEVVEFEIERAKISTGLASLDIREEIAIIRITSFGDQLDKKLSEIIDEIKANAEIKYLVIDLRSNGGGLLDQAVESSSYFMDEGSLIVSEKGKDFEKELKSVDKDKSLQDYPVLILVDGDTASASEIFAAALRYHHEAKLVGSNTFGKGSVQQIFTLNNGDSLKLTVANWYTPDGQNINEAGLEPDIKVNSQNALDEVLEYYDWEEGVLNESSDDPSGE